MSFDHLTLAVVVDLFNFLLESDCGALHIPPVVGNQQLRLPLMLVVELAHLPLAILVELLYLLLKLGGDRLDIPPVY